VSPAEGALKKKDKRKKKGAYRENVELTVKVKKKNPTRAKKMSLGVERTPITPSSTRFKAKAGPGGEKDQQNRSRRMPNRFESRRLGTASP